MASLWATASVILLRMCWIEHSISSNYIELGGATKIAPRYVRSKKKLQVGEARQTEISCSTTSLPLYHFTLHILYCNELRPKEILQLTVQCGWSIAV